MYQAFFIGDFHYPTSCDSKSETSTEGQDLQFHYDCLGNDRNIYTYGHGSKAKSSLCKNFTESGACPYGNKCQFAHGTHELRINMEHNRSYKTKGCHAFTKKGFCCYGDRCNFIHDKTPQCQDIKTKWSSIYSNHRQTLQSIKQPQSSKLIKILRL